MNGQDPDVVAAAAVAHDDALDLEPQEGLANRRPTDAELFGERLFVDALAGPEPTRCRSPGAGAHGPCPRSIRRERQVAAGCTVGLIYQHISRAGRKQIGSAVRSPRLQFAVRGSQFAVRGSQFAVRSSRFDKEASWREEAFVSAQPKGAAKD